MNDELERIWKEVEVVTSRHLPESANKSRNKNSAMKLGIRAEI
jgi:hypothetical protein